MIKEVIEVGKGFQGKKISLILRNATTSFGHLKGVTSSGVVKFVCAKLGVGFELGCFSAHFAKAQ